MWFRIKVLMNENMERENLNHVISALGPIAEVRHEHTTTANTMGQS